MSVYRVVAQHAKNTYREDFIGYAATQVEAEQLVNESKQDEYYADYIFKMIESTPQEEEKSKQAYAMECVTNQEIEHFVCGQLNDIIHHWCLKIQDKLSQLYGDVNGEKFIWTKDNKWPFRYLALSFNYEKDYIEMKCLVDHSLRYSWRSIDYNYKEMKFDDTKALKAFFMSQNCESVIKDIFTEVIICRIIDENKGCYANGKTGIGSAYSLQDEEVIKVFQKWQDELVPELASLWEKEQYNSGFHKVKVEKVLCAGNFEYRIWIKAMTAYHKWHINPTKVLFDCGIYLPEGHDNPSGDASVCFTVLKEYALPLFKSKYIVPVLLQHYHKILNEFDND